MAELVRLATEPFDPRFADGIWIGAHIGMMVGVLSAIFGRWLAVRVMR